MLSKFRTSGKSGSRNIGLWIVLGAAIVGLGGFSLVGVASSLASQNVADVGGEKVSRDAFMRSLTNSVNQMSARFNTQLTIEQARAFGLDRQVLGQLVTQAALDKQGAELEFSVGDEAVREALLVRPEFQGPTGGFDRFTYDQELQRSDLTPREYEQRIRKDVTRTLLEAGISGGVDMPDIMATTLLKHFGEKRSYSFVVIPRDRIGELPVPSDDELTAFFEQHPDDYTAPETRKVTYIALRPDDVKDIIEISDEDLQAEYDANIARFDTPERRVVDRIVFSKLEDATDAKAKIDAGDTTFNEIGEARGLSFSDMEVGEVRLGDLPAADAELVFGAESAGVVGPVETDLGPALYRLNAILAPVKTSFEDAKAELHDELADRRAGDTIGAEIDPVQDLLASGATLEEVADETAMILGTIDVNALIGTGLAADTNFRAEALAAAIGEERDLIDLSNGGIAALRIDEIQEPRLQTYDEVADQVASDWEVVAEQTALKAEADRLMEQLAYGRRFTAVMKTEELEVATGGPVRRGDTPQNLPASAIETVFEMDAGDVRVIEDQYDTLMISLDEVVPFNPEDAEDAARLEALQGQLSNTAARDIFFGFTQAVQNEAGVSINQNLIDETLSFYQ